MAREDASPILAKDFVLVEIDTDRMVGGKDLWEASRGKSRGIPWFAILEAEGKTLATSEGPKGNIGCPDTDDEIQFFMEILSKVRIRMTDEDLQALKASRLAHRGSRK